MATIIATGQDGPVQNYDVIVVHTGVVKPVGLPVASPTAAPFGWYENFLQLLTKIQVTGLFDRGVLCPQVPLAATTVAPFGWFVTFPGPPPLAKSLGLFSLTSPYANIPPPVPLIFGGPLAEGNFPTIVTRDRAIGY